MKISYRKQQQQQQGIALVIVMLVIMTLSTLAAGFALSMKVEMRLAAKANLDQQMWWMGIGGAEYARFVMTEQDKLPGPKIHSLNQLWAGGSGSEVTNGPLAGFSLKNIPLGGGEISLEITDLERKFNINSIPFKQGLMQQAMVVMGVDASSSPVISDSILDWIDPDNEARPSGAENQYYQAQDPPYFCKNGMVDEMTELLLVKGVTQEIFWGSSSSNVTVSRYQPRDDSPSQRDKQPVYECGLNDLFTSLSAGKLNVNTASLNTLRMVFNGDENMAKSVMSERDKGSGSPDGATQGSPFVNVADMTARVAGLTPLDTQRMNTLCDFRSSTFEVGIDVSIGDLSKHFVAIITRAGNGYVLVTFHEK